MNGEETMFGVNFADGRIKGYGLKDPRSRTDKTFYVLCVRGNKQYGQNQFVDNGDGTITDRATGLTWMKQDSDHLIAGLIKDGKLMWQQALAWADGLHSSELTIGLETLAAAQEADATWPKVEFFFVLEALLEIKHPLSMQMLKRALPRLLDNQFKNGNWGRRHTAAQTWIGVRALEEAGLRERCQVSARR